MLGWLLDYLVLGWAGVSLTVCLSVWIIGVQGPGSGANAIVLPSTHLHAHAHAHTHTHTGAQADQTTADQDRAQGGQPEQTGPLNLTPGDRSSVQRAAAAGCLVEPTQAASSSTPSPPSARTASCPSNTRSFSGILLDVCPRTPCFLFLAAPGSPGRKLCHIVVSSTSLLPGESHAFPLPSKLSNPKPKTTSDGGEPQLAVCHAMPPCHAMSPTCTLLSCEPRLPPICHLVATAAPGLEAFLSWRSDIGSQPVGSRCAREREGHGKQASRAGIRASTAQVPPPGHGDEAQSPMWPALVHHEPASPNTSHPPPRLLDEGSARAGTRHACRAWVSRGVALLICVSVNGAGRAPSRRQLL